MIAHVGDGNDTALARFLHESGSLDVAILQQALQAVRADRGAGGRSLADFLLDRQLVDELTLQQALSAIAPSPAAPAGVAFVPPPGLASDFEVGAELARGGMGAIYLVTHRASGTRYALKTMLPGLGDDEQRSEELVRFRREAEAIARLDHPNVVRIHAAELDLANPYLIQDFLPGGSLQQRLEAEGPISPPEATQIAIKLAKGLAHAHQRGLLHRDLKPHNVLFDDRGEPRLVDFGLTRDLDGSSLTQSGVVLGTPAFMAPEQALGGDVDERCDVYGMGAVLYAALTARAPFVGQGLGILASVVHDDPEPPGRYAQVPSWLDRVCLKALSKEPNDRFASARELVEALQAGSAGEVLVPQRERTRQRVRFAGSFAGGITLAAVVLVVVLSALQVARMRRDAERLRTRGELQKVLEDPTATIAHLGSQVGDWRAAAPDLPEWQWVDGLLALRRGEHASASAARDALSSEEDLHTALSAGALAASDEGDLKALRRLRKLLADRDWQLSDLRGWRGILELREGDKRGVITLQNVQRDRGALTRSETQALLGYWERVEEVPALESVLDFRERASPELAARLERLAAAIRAINLADGFVPDRIELTKGALPFGILGSWLRTEEGELPRFALRSLRSSVKAYTLPRKISVTEPAELQAAAGWIHTLRRLDLLEEYQRELAQLEKKSSELFFGYEGHDKQAFNSTKEQNSARVRAQKDLGWFFCELVECRPTAANELINAANGIALNGAKLDFAPGFRTILERLERPGDIDFVRILFARALVDGAVHEMDLPQFIEEGVELVEPYLKRRALPPENPDFQGMLDWLPDLTALANYVVARGYGRQRRLAEASDAFERLRAYSPREVKGLRWETDALRVRDSLLWAIKTRPARLDAARAVARDSLAFLHRGHVEWSDYLAALECAWRHRSLLAAEEQEEVVSRVLGLEDKGTRGPLIPKNVPVEWRVRQAMTAVEREVKASAVCEFLEDAIGSLRAEMSDANRVMNVAHSKDALAALQALRTLATEGPEIKPFRAQGEQTIRLLRRRFGK